ncbi:invasion protein [Azorhizobium oxalatiphilum]|uniref:Invasion protein n=1 Tax=Azorhizobium oxalatiphilum TaxID=980631 RepID=A0A917C1R3_9HYPH|nr:invasion associated locus B family protein [Azorhizobium oxalatiphilum]GGF63831.1 invasion protein [Azorhizobium oxalatiphilum]
MARTFIHGVALVATLSLALPALAQAPAPARAPALPGGASSLQETYEDWTVSCVVEGTARICRMSQQQRRQEGNQLVLAVDLTVGKTGASGALLMPFGLRLADGVTPQVDEGKPAQAVAFSTCLPAGCIVPLTLDAALIKTLSKATTLKLTAKAQDSGQDVTLSVPLKGFAAGYERLKGLAGS